MVRKMFRSDPWPMTHAGINRTRAAFFCTPDRLIFATNQSHFLPADFRKIRSHEVWISSFFQFKYMHHSFAFSCKTITHSKNSSTNMPTCQHANIPPTWQQEQNSNSSSSSNSNNNNNNKNNNKNKKKNKNKCNRLNPLTSVPDLRMDETPPLQTQIVSLGTDQCCFHWARSGTYFVGLEVRSLGSRGREEAVFRAEFEPAVTCSQSIGMRNGIRLPLEDHYVLRDEIEHLTFHVQLGPEVSTCKIQDVEHFVGQKCTWGLESENFHKVKLLKSEPVDVDNVGQPLAVASEKEKVGKLELLTLVDQFFSD